MREPSCSVLDKSLSPLPQPVFSSSPTVYTGRVTCQICFQSSLRKNKKRDKYQSIEKEKFLKYALEWKKVDHEYNLVHSKVDWNSDELLGHKNCKGIFFKDVFLSSQIQLSVKVNPGNTEDLAETEMIDRNACWK